MELEKQAGGSADKNISQEISIFSVCGNTVNITMRGDLSQRAAFSLYAKLS